MEKRDLLGSCLLCLFEKPVIRMILRTVDGVVACILRIAVEQGILSLSRNHAILRILESLTDMTIGWDDLTGRQKDLAQAKFEDAVVGLKLVTRAMFRIHPGRRTSPSY